MNIIYETKSEKLWSMIDKRHRLIVNGIKGKFVSIAEITFCEDIAAVIQDGKLKVFEIKIIDNKDITIKDNI